MGGGTDPIRSVGRLVVGGFVAMVVAFALVMALTQLFGSGIHHTAKGIVENGSPSVIELSDARAELRHLQVLLDDAVELAPAKRRPEQTAALRRSWARVQRIWHRYEARRTFPGESALWPEVEQDLAALSPLLDRALAARGEGDRFEALDAAKVKLDQLDGGFIRLVRFNREEDVHLARQIDRIWRRSLVIAVVGVLVVVALCLATALALARLVRRTTRTLQERADELDAFAGRIAHDLMSPLTATVMTLAVARESLPLDDHGLRLVDRAVSGVRRAAALVNDLYRYATAGGLPEAGARTDVADALRGVVEQEQPIAAQHAAELALEPVPPSAVACPHGVLVSILTNLVDNALKHMGERERRRVAVRVHDGSDRVRIEVEDSGPGIPADELARVFQPYVRGATAAGGLGLGLATVKRLTERYGGRIGVRSVVGEGSTFWFELPKPDRAPQPT